MDIKCPKCGSEYVYESKRKKANVCEDCGFEFVLEKSIKPQKVFLSYGHDKNREVVEYIYDKLVERGHKPWIDKSNIKYGDDWRNAITKGILESEGFLAFISKHSVRVPGVSLDEISIAVGNYNCRIQSVLLEKDVMPPNTICNIQFIDMSNWKEVKDNSTEKEYNKWLDDKVNSIYEIIENENNIRVAGNISMLENKLEPITSSLKLRAILKNEIVSRNWIVDIIKEKIEKKCKAIVIYGTPGTGKSVLSAYLANFFADCIASFFCEWNNSLSYDTQKLLHSIIFQLACYIEDYQNIIVELLKNYSLNNKSSDEIIYECIKKPLNSLIDGNRSQKIIIIDALDESVNENTEFLDVVLKLIDSLPEWVSVMITTRPECKIVEGLKPFESINIDDYKEQIKDDIKNYVYKRIGDNETSNNIIDKSDGSFVYAKELIDLYKDSKEDFNLDKIPKGLGGIYFSNFNRIFKNSNLFKDKFEKIFAVILAAKEQMSINEVAAILNIAEEEFNDCLKLISSYVYKMRVNDKYLLQVFHKSFLEWIVTDSAGQYKIDSKKGNKILFDYLLKILGENADISKYYMKYAFDHISSIDYEELDYDLKMKLLNKLSISASLYGDLKMEEFYLDKIAKDFKDTKLYFKREIELYKKVSGSKLIDVTNKAMAMIDSFSDEAERFDLISCISFAFFYAGYSEKSYNLIKEERNKHDEKFWKEGLHEADYWHAIAVTAHDLDKNYDVINAAKIDVDTYKQRKKFYNQYISMVNLMDGYMAVGDLSSADKLSYDIFDYLDNRYYIHVDDILQICYANLLQTEGRIMESLVYYENGLKIAKDIQSWDYIYGSIWRELAILRTYDASSIDRLRKYRKLAIDTDYRYLISLADIFIVISNYKLGVIDNDEIKELVSEINDLGFPGHILQSLICGDLLNKNINNLDNIISLLQECNGVKGMPELVDEYLNVNREKIDSKNTEILSDWIEKFVKPIYEYREKFFMDCTKELDDDVYLCATDCNKCQSKCCYDGVYVSKDEEENIIEFVNNYKEEFENIKTPYIVDGNWPGMRSQRKTEKVDKLDYDETYPKHFTKTKCIFELENGACQLQKVATEKQLHPWKVKPKACWLFPIRVSSNNELLPPLTNIDADTDYIDDNYPGYATFMPCVINDKNGVVWYNKYHNEIEYFKYLIKKQEGK